MAIRIVRLGSPRHAAEGVRLGTVRRPPRGVPKTRYAADNWFDVWLPELAPSAALVALASASTDPKVWRNFVTRYEREMSRPESRHLLEMLAALSHRADFSVGCYCENELRCHRSVLRRLLKDHGAIIAD